MAEWIKTGVAQAAAAKPPSTGLADSYCHTLGGIDQLTTCREKNFNYSPM
jgi:hypothetical protein